MFEKYRISENFYTDFAGTLMTDVLRALPQVEYVDVGAYNFVDPWGPLVTRVLHAIKSGGRRLTWNEENGWGQRMKRVEEYGQEEVVDDESRRQYLWIVGAGPALFEEVEPSN